MDEIQKQHCNEYSFRRLYVGMGAMVDMQWVGGAPISNSFCGGNYNVQAYKNGTVYGVDSHHFFREASSNTFWAGEGGYIDVRFNYTRPLPPTIQADGSSTILANGQGLAAACAASKVGFDSAVEADGHKRTDPDEGRLIEYDMLSSANQLASEEQFDESFSLLQQLAADTTRPGTARAATIRLGHLYSQWSDQRIVRVLTKLLSSTMVEEALVSLIHIAVIDQDFERALSWIQLALDRAPSDMLNDYARAAAFDIHRRAGRLNLAKEMLSGMSVGESADLIHKEMMQEDLARATGMMNGAPPEKGSSGLISFYPNPPNPSGHIRFDVAREGPVTLTIYDLVGRKVSVILDGVLSSGEHRIFMDLSLLNSGTYVYRLTLADGVHSGTFTVLK